MKARTRKLPPLRIGAFLLWALCLASCFQDLPAGRIVKIEDPPAVPEPEVFYTLKFAVPEGGSVTVTPEKDSYRPGERVLIAAEAESGCRFGCWSGTEEGSENPMILAMAEDEWIIANFSEVTVSPEAPSYTLRVDSSPNGTVAVDPEKARYVEGDYVKVTAVPNPGYLFSGWTGTAGGSENPMVLRMAAHQWLIPRFERERTYQVITDRNPLGGTVAVNPDRTSGYRQGEGCVLTAVADSGYRFDGWSGDISGTQRNLFITFDRDYRVQAEFSAIPTEITYTLTVIPPANGTVTLEPDKAAYYENETVRVTAVPSPGYMLSSWSGPVSPGRTLSFELAMDGNKTLSASYMKRGWTHLLYMAADNSLDSQALNDLNEMEAAATDGKAMSILVLVDRKAGNGDWPDTRLYEIAQDPGGNSAGLVSRRLDSAELGLSRNAASELNLSDPVNLERFVAFAKRAYGADRYSLTLWGHGTGWRGGDSPASDGAIPMRAVAVDETSQSYMGLSGLGDALEGEGLSVIGFDTCFGALLEIAYELRDCGGILAGSEGPTRETGWNYAELFSSATGSSTPSEFAGAMVDAYRDSYESEENGTFSVVSLASVPSLHAAFGNWASTLASLVDTSAEQGKLRSALFDPSKIDAFYFAGIESDYYADIASLTLLSSSLAGSGILEGSGAALLVSRGTALRSALDQAVLRTWSRKYGETRDQLGVFVIGVSPGKVPMSGHSPAYVRGSGGASLDFVNDTPSWVPNDDCSAISVLNRLFYSVF